MNGAVTDFSDVESILSLIPKFTPLQEHSSAYFISDPASIEIPLSELISTRLRPDGLRSAAKFMALAAAGEMDRRKPISVSKRGDGRWDVVDGNSTVAVARASRWNSIPCKPDT